MLRNIGPNGPYQKIPNKRTNKIIMQSKNGSEKNNSTNPIC